jgi:anhydro-N-acetylmuramic acid kinase
LDKTVPAEDIQATLAELTAVSLARAIASSCVNVIDVPICGGGRHNVHLMLRISVALRMLGNEHCCVQPSEHWQVDGDSVESAAFAWLAYRRISQRPANLPEVTGAIGQRILGAIYPAR